MQNCYKILLPLLMVLLISACKNDRWDVDVSDIKADIEIQRLDAALAKVDTANVNKQLDTIIERHSVMMKALLESVLEYGPMNDPRTIALFKRNYLFDPYKDTLFMDVLKKYTHEKIAKLESELEEAFRHYKYHYKNDSIPKVYTLVTTNSLAVFTIENRYVGIGLDMFMGSDYRFYNAEIFTDYMVRYFQQEYILPRVMKSIYQGRYEETRQVREQNLLNNMLYQGKTLMFVKAMVPQIEDTVLFEYTEKQLKWTKDNEAQIWDHLINKVSIYTTDQFRIDKYIQPGPYTVDEGVPPESAPRLGHWIGYQIVKAYMERHPDVTLEELCRETDFKKILRESRYRPG